MNSEGKNISRRRVVQGLAIGASAALATPLAGCATTSEEAPLVNPAFVIKNWGHGRARVTVDGKRLRRGEQVRLGRRDTLEGSDLIIWIKTESTEPVQITVSPPSN